MGNRNYLFSKVEWHRLKQDWLNEIAAEIDGINGDRMLNTSVDDLCDYFEEKYCINVPTLDSKGAVADQHETKIDVSGDPRRGFLTPGQPFYLSGTTFEVEIPFEGDANMFHVRPSTRSMNPPCADVKNDSLTIGIEGIDLTVEQVQNGVSGTIAEIERHLNTLRSDASGFNSQIRSVSHAAIERRRSKLLKDRNILGDLGFKIREREGEARTYSAPEVRRKLAPKLPAASVAPYKPEPILIDAHYDHILGVIESLVDVMERSPSAFKSVNEETIRFHILVQLNGHYEGGATAETFNYQGKTDILLRSNGKNIFIAECKFWDGPKKLIEAIDQVLSYSSWRDTKVAVIVFNRKKSFSKVLDSILETSKVHSNFKRQIVINSETMFRFVFAHRDDPNREMFLTVMAFNVPV